jgi:hypothetical protein
MSTVSPLSRRRIVLLSATFIALSALLVASPAIPGWLDAARSALTPSPSPETVHRYAMTFRHLGFAEPETCTSASYPQIERKDVDKRTVFLVRALIPCGLEVHNPAHYVQGDTLHLSYETHLDGPVDLCDCEYRSEFTFTDLPPRVTKVDFMDASIDGYAKPVQ